MKKYLIQKIVEAEPMLKMEAEARLGREVNGNKKDSLGYLVCGMTDLKWDWVSQRKFHGIAFNTPNDKMIVWLKQLEEWQKFFKDYSKKKERTSNMERIRIYQTNRHIKSLIESVKAIININLIQQ